MNIPRQKVKLHPFQKDTPPEYITTQFQKYFMLPCAFWNKSIDWIKLVYSPPVPQLCHHHRIVVINILSDLYKESTHSTIIASMMSWWWCISQISIVGRLLFCIYIFPYNFSSFHKSQNSFACELLDRCDASLLLNAFMEQGTLSQSQTAFPYERVWYNDINFEVFWIYVYGIIIRNIWTMKLSVGLDFTHKVF